MKTTQDVIVHLRTRESKGGKQLLYLDITEYGKRRKEALHMYYEPGKDRATKRKNEETRIIAERKARMREEELLNEADGFERDDLGLDKSFFAWFEQCANNRREKTRRSWYSALMHLKEYEKDQGITFRKINRRWIEGFREYLLSSNSGNAYKCCLKINEDRIDVNSASLYFSKVIACINDAKSMGYIKRDPLIGVKPIRVISRDREHLDMNEIKMLMSTDCNSDVTKRSFLFACFTGLRFSDVKQIRWSNIKPGPNGLVISKVQQKTERVIYLPIPEIAVQYMGEPKDDDSLVFDGLVANYRANKHIKSWCEKAGIKRHITFHCSRHSNAIIQLQNGTDIYTISKMLGHASVQTTQIYAKVTDKLKQEAADRLSSLFK